MALWLYDQTGYQLLLLMPMVEWLKMNSRDYFEEWQAHHDDEIKLYYTVVALWLKPFPFFYSSCCSTFNLQGHKDVASAQCVKASDSAKWLYPNPYASFLVNKARRDRACSVRSDPRVSASFILSLFYISTARRATGRARRMSSF